MKRIIYIIVTVIVIAAGSSCASIVTRSSYPVDFGSTPQSAELTIENRDGQPFIRAEQCNGCSLCEVVCPFKAIHPIGEKEAGK